MVFFSTSFHFVSFRRSLTNINDLRGPDHLCLVDSSHFKVIGMKETSHKSIFVWINWKSEPILENFDWFLAKQKRYVY